MGGCGAASVMVREGMIVDGESGVLLLVVGGHGVIRVSTVGVLRVRMFEVGVSRGPRVGLAAGVFAVQVFTAETMPVAVIMVLVGARGG